MELPGSQSPRTKELSALVRYKSILNSIPPTVTNLKSTDPDTSSPPQKKELSPGEKVIWKNFKFWQRVAYIEPFELYYDFIVDKRRHPG